MSRIRPLDPVVVNKIAAGEVIERPASVVKELLENSLDALATRIEVEVVQGGSELIRVVDDGEGIHPDDLLLAVSSHATSKITGDDDLFRVHTLGFRGEALASIASVSRLTLRSRTAGQAEGFEVEVRGGEIAQGPRPCGCPAGTQIEVRQLFGNTPVRRKFLKAVATEFGHVSEQFTRIALARPRLHAVLRHNGKAVYELPPTDRLLDRLRLFFGAELADNLIQVESQAGDIRLWGYVAHPGHSKANRKGEYLFLNGRWIQDRSLQHALGEAYRGLLMTGRYPIAFLFLEVPPELVDVNVHPTKAEVRFRDGQQLYRQLLSTLRTRFLGMDLDSPMRLSGAPSDDSPAPDPERRRALQTDLADWARRQLTQWTPTESIGGPPAEPGSGDVGRVIDPAAPGEDEGAGGDGEAASGADSRAAEASIPDHGACEQGEADPAVPFHGPLRVMQIHDCYLVVETREGLTVIDQHALHERVMYEQLRRRVLAGAVESQRMLVPQPVEADASAAAALLEHQELLAQLGFGIEEFGRGTLLLTAYPVMLARADHVQLVRDVAEQLQGAGPAPTRRDLLDSLLHMMACKAAIKAGQRLAPEEMESLLAQRHLIDDAHHCPHGRPTALVLSRSELDRQFGRLG